MLQRIRALLRPEASGRSWFKINNATANDVAEVLIYDEIGFWGITAADFASAIQGITAPKILVRLNTPGGDVFDGFAIYNALKSHPSEVTTQIDSLAASIGSVIALAGDKVQAAQSAFVMVHNPWSIVMGDAAEMRQMADTLDKVGGSIAAVYQERTKASADQVKAWMDAETWFTAEEAKAAGLIDEVMSTGGAKATLRFDLAAFRNAPKALTETPAEEPTVKPPETVPSNVTLMRHRLALKRRREGI